MHPIDSWYAVLDTRELRRSEPLVARRFGLDLVFWRDAEGQPRCVLDRCPHRGASLGAGKVRDGQIECPFHGFRWDGQGDCVKVPCNGPDQQRPRHLATQAFELREAHGLVWLWWGEARDEYPEVPFFAELASGYEYATFTVDTAVNWMRNVENQLDWPHLPFIHRTTIGVGATAQMEVRSVIDGDRLDTWLAEHEDERGRPELTISYLFPNLWLNPFGGARIMGFMAFAPIDETHSRMYVRTYVRRLAIPGLARVVAALTNLFNRVVLGQDLRVVHTQPPGPTSDERDERLVQADLPIAQFRKQVARRSGDPSLVQLRRRAAS